MSRRFYLFAVALVLLGTGPTLARAQRGGGPPGGGGRPGGGMPGMNDPGGPNGGPMGVRPGSPSNSSGSFSPMRSGPQLGLPGRWWDDKHAAKAINLRSDQQHKMDDIFEANKAGLVAAYGNLEREENKLSTMPSQDLQDEAKVFAAIDHVAQARAELEKQTAHILLQIRQQMDSDQLTRLDKEIAAGR